MKATATTPNTLPREIYDELYDYICDSLAEHGECDEDGRCKDYFEFESEDGKYSISGEVEAYFEYEDDSFSHEFGIEECGHWEFDKLDSISVDYCGTLDDDDNEIELPFDMEIFNHLHDKTTIKINGVTINAGDDIVVKPLFGKWLLGTFKYYDPIDKVYFYDGDCWSYSYKILPATEQNRQLIGNY